MGFQYEMLVEFNDLLKQESDTRWVKMKIPGDWQKFMFDMDRVLSSASEKLRVKIIEPSDFIQMKFVKDDARKNTFIKQKTNEFILEVEWLERDGLFPTIQITYWNFEEGNKLVLSNIFSGQIKNKSEFKKIIYQLTRKE